MVDRELKDFDPNGVGVVGESYFSLPSSVESARVVLLSAPWDVTVSYGGGCSAAPDAILEASSQLDLYDSSARDAWREGIATLKSDGEIGELSTKMRPVAQRVIEHLERGGGCDDSGIADDLRAVNEASREVNEIIYRRAKEIVARGQIVGLVGGDHSTPYGVVRALGERYDSFGVLHIDAHRDLREAYEGFEYSHASIMFNLLRDMDHLHSIVQVGVRDFCDAEQQLACDSERVVSFEDMTLARGQFEGESWGAQCRRIVDVLPQRVYISFDIDGLEIAYCPYTGTPVSGGLSFNQALYLLEQLVESGREIIGFDLVEVVPSGAQSRVDVIVGARMLYKLCGLSIKSKNGKNG